MFWAKEKSIIDPTFLCDDNVLASGKQDAALECLKYERDEAVNKSKNHRLLAKQNNEEAAEFEQLARDYQTAIDKLTKE